MQFNYTNSICRHSLPRIISQLYIKYRAQSTKLERLNAAKALVEGIVRFLSVIAVSNVYSDAHANIPKTSKIKDAPSLLLKPSFGLCFNLFKGCVDFLIKNDLDPFCPELCELRKDEAFKQAIEHIAKVRNETAHDKQGLSEEGAFQYLGEIESDLILILSRVQFLKNYKLGHFQNREGRKQINIDWVPAQGGNLGEIITFQFNKNYCPPQKKPILINPKYQALVLYPHIAMQSLSGASDYYWFKSVGSPKCTWVHPMHIESEIAKPLLDLDNTSTNIDHYKAQPEEWHELSAELDQDQTVYSLLRDEPLFLKDYTQKKKIGSGGMGVVYRALNNFDRLVAIKVLKKDLMLEIKQQKQFEREAKILGGFDHPNIVKIFKTGYLNEGEPYIEMEYLNGFNLQEDYENRLDQKDLNHHSVYTPYEALHIVRSILKALVVIHQKNIIHRDLKPQNIFVCANEDKELGEIKIIDFGISKSLLKTQQTRFTTFHIMGTEQWMAPEQTHGIASIQSDIFAVGKILSFLLNLDHKAPRSYPDFSDKKLKQLQRISEKAQQVEASKRYQSADEMLTALKQFKQNEHSKELHLTKRNSRPKAKDIEQGTPLIESILFIVATNFRQGLESFTKEAVKLQVNNIIKFQTIEANLLDEDTLDLSIEIQTQIEASPTSFDALCFVANDEFILKSAAFEALRNPKFLEDILEHDLPIYTAIGLDHIADEYELLSSIVEKSFSTPLHFLRYVRNHQQEHISQVTQTIYEEISDRSFQVLAAQQSLLEQKQKELTHINQELSHALQSTFGDILHSTTSCFKPSISLTPLTVLPSSESVLPELSTADELDSSSQVEPNNLSPVEQFIISLYQSKTGSILFSSERLIMLEKIYQSFHDSDDLTKQELGQKRLQDLEIIKNYSLKKLLSFEKSLLYSLFTLYFDKYHGESMSLKDAYVSLPEFNRLLSLRGSALGPEIFGQFIKPSDKNLNHFILNKRYPFLDK